MKKIKWALLVLLLLTGCDKTSSSIEDSISNTETSDLSSEVNSNSETPTSEDISGSEGNSSSEVDPQRYLNFYAINDFHGAIMESSSEPGIFKLGTYFKEKEAQNPGENIFINVGDYWQGSADSNLNRGEFLTKAMDVLNFSAMTLGNHEFDWFDTVIEHNKEVANYPFLAANVILKETGKHASNIASYDDTFKASTMITQNGVNVGIIGTIGSGLESSILGTAVAPYSFEPVDKYIREEATNLKSLGADVIVLSTHDSLFGGNGEYSGICDDSVVDVIFSGHQHALDNRVSNGIPILQTNGYGKQVMEVNALFDLETKQFDILEQNTIDGLSLKSKSEDPELLALFAPYEENMTEIKNEVIGTLTSSISKIGLVNMANSLMADFASSLGYSNIVTVHNTGGVRVDSIAAGQVTYGDIYRAFPFDNEIMVVENLSGQIVYNFIGFNVSNPNRFYIDTSATYTLVTIDYLSYNTYSNILNKTQIPTKNYVRELITEYFLAQGSINGSSW